MHKRILEVWWKYFKLNKNVVTLNLADTIMAVKSYVAPLQDKSDAHIWLLTTIHVVFREKNFMLLTFYKKCLFSYMTIKMKE